MGWAWSICSIRFKKSPANDVSPKDNMEIVAFARAYNVDVKVYQQEFAMQFSGNDESDELRQLIHIAYHASLLSNVDVRYWDQSKLFSFL